MRAAQRLRWRRDHIDGMSLRQRRAPYGCSSHGLLSCRQRNAVNIALDESTAMTQPSPSAEPSAAQPSAALSGLTVIDLTRVRAGPTCVRQLADWGAKVIKIEMPEEDGGATQTDFSARHEPDFQNLHRNKRSMTLNLKDREGIAILRRLIERADVVVENYRPDVKFRLGIDYESLGAINPRLIYASISGFGEDGPYRDRPGVDQIAQGMSGLMSITGEPGRGPMRVGTALADLSAGVFAAMGILTALYERERSGKGQWVKCSLLAAQIFMLDFQAARFLMAGEVAGQVGNNHPTGVPTGAFPTADGYVNVAPTPVMWKRFCKAIEREDLMDHPDYATPKARRSRREELNAMIAEITKGMTTGALVDRLNQAGIPCGPIYTIDQTFADPQVKHLGIVQSVHSPKLGPINLVGQPFTLSRTPSRLASAAPDFGEHTDQILGELGFSADDIARLRQTGTV
jgi:crotonobetainyl-CoA:carnitine CoA-transferase CaiB-like acyl-CoA transferase